MRISDWSSDVCSSDLMALVAIPAEGPDRRGLGVVRLIADPENQRAEFAITIRSQDKGRGLGRPLMARIMSYAVNSLIGQIWREVLAEPARMLPSCEWLGCDTAFPEVGIAPRTARTP